MPRKQTISTGELPLPAGWEAATDYDGKRFFIDHTTKQTTWIDPRDRLTKPVSFADCVGDELPYGWEQAYDPQVGIYFVDHVHETTQLEDPRLQWREMQERMLSEYLAHAHEDLMAKKEIFNVKQERLAIAQEEVNHLQLLNDQWKTSRTSLNSTTSVSSKYDPELLKADVEMAKKRVARLKQELQQIHTDVWYKEKGLDTLSIVRQKMAGEQSRYTVEQAHQILNQINDIRKSVCINEQEKRQLLQGLAKLKEEVLMNKAPNGSSPDVSTLSIPRERLSTASQTDLNWDGSNNENRWGEIVRVRLQYDEAKKQVRNLQEQLAEIEEKMVPGQPESDKDRLMLIQEKEQLLRELRGKNPKGLDAQKMSELQARISQLENDLKEALQLSTKQIAERLKLNETKSKILEKLAAATHLTSYLESELKSLSVSTLSVSSGSSRSSLGSLSASSKGSLNSLSLTDLYTYSQSYSDVNLPELHHRVEKVLQGHNTSLQAAPGAGISPIREVDLPGETIGSPVMVSAAAAQSRPAPSQHMTRLLSEMSLRNSLSPGSSVSSLSSPPVSPYDAGPPPSYQQHLEKQRNITSASGSAVEQVGTGESGFVHGEGSATSNSQTGYNHVVPAAMNQGSVYSTGLPHTSQSLPQNALSVDHDASVNGVISLSCRNSFVPETENVTNPPLSPISESSSGVCNNASGVNTRSVSAAVSDESVAGDSGVFEASSKRSAELDDVLDMSLESAQVQIRLKYDEQENELHVGIEQARNLMALAFREKCQVCIKVMLLPSSTPTVFTTHVSSEVNNPKFSEQCKLSIPANKLMSKTLQVQVWCVQDGGEEECMGGAQVSLAAFDPGKVKFEWYNVLSFKFMQSESGVTRTEASDQHNKGSSSVVAQQQTDALSGPVSERLDHVSPLVEMSSVKPRRLSLGEEKTSHLDMTKDCRMRSLSFDSSCFRAFGQGGVTFSSLKEESSDESTIISSQTSTLTRNQGPDDMFDAPLGQDEDEDEEDDELSDSPDEDSSEMKHMQNIQSQLLDASRKVATEMEPNPSPDGTIKQVTCDKQTNTEVKCTLKSSTRKCSPNVSAVAARNSVIRRSQTFSPMGKVSTPEYICKLNRSDSDSSVRNKKPFQRNAAERRSMRFRKMLPHLGKSHSLTSFDRLRSVTSIDLELDLQAHQARLSQLNDEISRLKEIKKKFEEAKIKGESEPNWFVDNEQLQHFMAEADKALATSEVKSDSKVDERAAKLLKQATREAHRLRRSRKMNEPDPLAFRAKMAYLATMSLKIPVIQDLDADIKGMKQSAQHHRHAHSDPLRGLSQMELRQLIAANGQRTPNQCPATTVPAHQSIPLSLPQVQAPAQVCSVPVTVPQAQSMKAAVSQPQFVKATVLRIPNNQGSVPVKQCPTAAVTQAQGFQLPAPLAQGAQATIAQKLGLQLDVQQSQSQTQGVLPSQNIGMIGSPQCLAPAVTESQNMQRVVPKPQSVSMSIVHSQNVTMSASQSQNLPAAVLQSAGIATGVAFPQNISVSMQQSSTPTQQGHCFIGRPVSQMRPGPSLMPNSPQLPLQSPSAVTTSSQRRAQSFNEGADRSRASNVPIREHSFSHTRSGNEQQARVQEIGEHPLAQVKRLQLGNQQLVQATEEQEV